MPRRHLLALVAIAITARSLVAAPPVMIDGRFGDWSGEPAAVDPAGDATGAFDVTQIQVASRGTVLYFRFDTGTTLNLQSGDKREGTLIFRIGTPEGETLAVDVRQKTFTLLGGAQRVLRWADFDYMAAPTWAANDFEAMIDLSSLGVRTGDRVSIDLAGSDTLDRPIVFRLTDGVADRTAPRSPARETGTDFRIVSMNTERNGLVDRERQAALGRLLRGPQPDIITIQEEYETSGADVKSALDKLVPGQPGWNVHKTNDCVIASRKRLAPLRSYDGSYAAALVQLDGDEAVLVLSIHPKCCGHTGSKEDRRRIEQTRAMIRTIDELRAAPADGEFGPYRNAPVVVIGDWNLVGSRIPLDLLTDPDEAGLTRRLLLTLENDRVVTWIDENSPFSPGQLDLVVFDAEKLEPKNGFVLDTRTLDDRELDALDVESADSDATDHLLLVVDFALRR